MYLAKHFCRDEWLKSPLNRPETFELHAHKQFALFDKVMVNSWVRNKTGTLVGTDEAVVLVEQDLNTREEDNERDYSASDLDHFFEAAVRELDVMLGLYYPAVK